MSHLHTDDPLVRLHLDRALEALIERRRGFADYLAAEPDLPTPIRVVFVDKIRELDQAIEFFVHLFVD